MEVILLEKINRLGDIGDTVKVKSGFGRNYLLPKDMALTATPENRKVFDERKAELMKKAKDSFNAASMRAGRLSGQTVTVRALASEEGKLYGSVGPAEVAQAAVSQGLEVDKGEIDLPDGPAHVLGTYAAIVRLHAEVEAELTVVVERQVRMS